MAREAAGRRVLRGAPAAPGLGLGRAWVVDAPGHAAGEPHAAVADAAAHDPAAEVGRWRAARERVAAELEALAGQWAAEGREAEAEILRAQRLIALDPELDAQVQTAVARGVPAGQALRQAAEAYARALEALDDPYLRERAADVRDVAAQLAAALAGGGPGAGGPPGEDPLVLVGAEVGASQLARWRHRTAGVAMERGGSTAHVVIMARALGVPVVTGVPGLLDAVTPGDELLVDGDAGEVVVAPGPEERQRAARDRARAAAERVRLQAEAGLPAVTRDGFTVELALNIGHPDEIAAAEPYGFDAVGLFRTEFLFLERATPPDEEEQYRAYRAAVGALRGRPLVLRTLDAGADKRLPFIPWPQEENPALGWRGARVGLDRPDLLLPQLRAALRAAAHGPVTVMFPMVTTRDELLRLKELLARAAAELAREGTPAGRVAVGAMVETPAAALAARALAAEVDFLSIGTNDLVQYTLAVDRTSARVAHLYDPYHPAVLRLVAETAAAAREAGIPCGVCGELAGEPLAAPFFVGVGVTELSMAAPRLPRVRRVIRALERAAAERLAAEVLGLADGREVRERLRAFLAELGLRDAV